MDTKFKLRFIGVYDYTVILSLLGLSFAVLGMILTVQGRGNTPLCCLALSGLCDAFDGRVARTKKNRTQAEKYFGMELDALCDIVNFGVFPAMLFYYYGVCGWFGILICIGYCICAVQRLGYYNVLELTKGDEQGESCFHGLPVTSISVILPLFSLLTLFLPSNVFAVLLHILAILISTLFILDIRVKKLSVKQILLFTGIVFCGFVFFAVASHLM